MRASRPDQAPAATTTSPAAQHAVAGVDGARADRPHLDAGAQAHAALDRRGADASTSRPGSQCASCGNSTPARAASVSAGSSAFASAADSACAASARPAGEAASAAARCSASSPVYTVSRPDLRKPPSMPSSSNRASPSTLSSRCSASPRAARRAVAGADVAREPGSERRAHAEPERRVAPQHPAQPGAKVLGRGDRPRVARHEQARVPPRAALAPAAAALEHGDRGAVAGELVGAARAHDPGADHDDVGRAARDSCRAGGHQSAKPAGNGSSASSRYSARPVTQARPVISGTTASRRADAGLPRPAAR